MFSTEAFSQKTASLASQAFDISVTDADGRFLALSDACAAMFGLTADQARGRRLHDVAEQYEAAHFAGSPHAGRCARAFEDMTSIALSHGCYACIVWFCDRQFRLMRYRVFVKPCPLGFTWQFCPAEDGLSGRRLVRYDWKKELFHDADGVAFDWIDLAIYDGVMSGMTLAEIEGEHKIPLHRIRYRLRKLLKNIGEPTVQSARRHSWASLSDAIVPAPHSIAHGEVSHLAKPGDWLD